MLCYYHYRRDPRVNFPPSTVLWRQILKTNFRHWEKLANFLELSHEQRTLIDTTPNFSLNLPLRLAKKIKKGDLNDPLLMQFLPRLQEKESDLAFVDDPTADTLCQRTPKLLHKYHGRALLICTSACAMHCRYCFRQNYPYETSGHSFHKEIEEISADPSLSEIILSGGDPLSLSDRSLKSLFDRLSAIEHVRRIRFHTRFPIGIPERIDSHFLKLLEGVSKQIWFIIHANHPAEFDEEIWEALTKIRKLGIPILNQGVLLKNVNDNVETLKTLCQQLVDHGITPYYLHQLDRVKGTGHFEVPEEEGLRLINELRKQLSGYAVPLYVREIPGELSKTPIDKFIDKDY